MCVYTASKTSQIAKSMNCKLLTLCAECMCHVPGTASQACRSGDDCECQKHSGQCTCKPNVVGQNCDRCATDTWNLASGEGCQRCDCDPVHSFGSSCNEVRLTTTTTTKPCTPHLQSVAAKLPSAALMMMLSQCVHCCNTLSLNI